MFGTIEFKMAVVSVERTVANVCCFCLLQDDDKANFTHSRLLQLCRSVSTEHILHKFDVTDPTVVSLTSKPAKLICQLYENYGAREPGSAHQPPGMLKDKR